MSYFILIGLTMRGLFVYAILRNLATLTTIRLQTIAPVQTDVRLQIVDPSIEEFGMVSVQHLLTIQ